MISLLDNPKDLSFVFCLSIKSDEVKHLPESYMLR